MRRVFGLGWGVKVIKEINIWWEGPFTHNEIVDNKIDNTKYDNKATSIGIYQIYGTHPLYGCDVLLYIGRTKQKNGFSKRLKDRWVIENGNDTENIKIYLGVIFSYDKDVGDEENMQIDIAETLLINIHKPAYNSSNIQSISKKYIEDRYLIQNMNNYRSLYPVISSKYLENITLNFDYTDKLSKAYSAKVVNNDSFYGFNIENDNIFIGIDYICWNETKVPLQIGISKNINKKISIDYNIIYEDEDLYYISAIDKLDENVNIDSIKVIINGISKSV